MICSIKLKNIALIKEAEINFCKGLNVISGETGAGKTIFINAINFALGAKADKTMISHGENMCEAELLVKVLENSEAVNFLNQIDILCDDGEILIRRRLFTDGRSDIKVNGTTVTLSMLKKLTLTLCDIYGQSEHYSLLQKSNQLKVLDKFIGNEVILLKDKIKKIIDEIKQLNEHPALHLGSERERATKLDILSYQINEIEKAELVDGEEENLIQNRKIFKNIEKIGENLQIITEVLGGDNMVVDLLSTSVSKMNNLADFSKDYELLQDRLYNVKTETSDILSEVENLLGSLDYDSNELAKIESRLDLIHSLKRKYGDSVEEIIDFYNKAKLEYDSIIDSDKLFNEINNQIENNYLKLKDLYQNLHNLRCKKAIEFSNKIQDELLTLGMPNAKFNIQIDLFNDLKVLLENGADEVEFTFSANKGEPLSNMAKVISGGEMSRFMLAMKLVSSDTDNTYIFDEIDAGISGDIANIISQKFALLSKNIQIITISHLAQIISYSDASFKIQKTTLNDKTVTNIINLDLNGKIDEIVRIIGGGNNDVSLFHAKNLIKLADDFKANI